MGTKKSKNRSKRLSPQAPPPVAEEAPRRTRKWPLVVVLAVLAGIGTWWVVRSQHEKRVSAGRCRDYNLLLVTLDTTRADRLPAYGYKNLKAPNLDRLATESYVFDDAIAHVPLTLPSHTSIMTGRLPIGHGVRDNGGFLVDPREITLAEILKNAGYATSAFVSAYVLESRWQLNQGFDLYYDNFNLGQLEEIVSNEVERRAGETEIEFEHWLDRHKDRKFFSWVHFYDPHDPYDPPEPYKTEYAKHPYDGEIAYMDEMIGKLMSRLEAANLMEHTIIVVTGDHGESLGEHGELSHGMFLYGATQHVPLFIYIPGGGSGRVAGVVRHIDLAPTILDLLGVETPAQMQGKSLIGKINGTEKGGREAYSESLYSELHYGWSPLMSIRTDDYLYVRAPHPELYDREADPGDTKNLIQEKASFAKVLDKDLSGIEATYAAANLSGPQKMDSETEEKLRALGYIGGAARSTEESRKIDPKDKVGLARLLHQASFMLQQKSYSRVIELLTPVVQEDPDLVDAHFALGVAYVGTRQIDRGIDELLKTIAMRPDHIMALYNLGSAYEKRDLNEASVWYLKLLQHEPRHMLANMKLAHIYREQNRPELARRYFLAAVSAYRDALETTQGAAARASLLSTLGEIYFGAGDLSQAESNFVEALRLAPTMESLNYNLAMIYEAKGDIASAAAAYQKEIQAAPGNFKAFNNLGLIYKDTRRLPEAAQCFQKVIELDPQQPNGYVLLASTYKEMGRPQDASQVLRQAQMRNVPLHVQ